MTRTLKVLSGAAALGALTLACGGGSGSPSAGDPGATPAPGATPKPSPRPTPDPRIGLAPGPVGFLGTGPVFFTAKPPVENGILMAGDAAGVLDPFSGEGMSAALASGILAADVVERGLAGDLSRDESARVYETEWRRRFARRFAWSAAFRRLILHPTIGAVAGRLAGEKLVRFAISATRR